MNNHFELLREPKRKAYWYKINGANAWAYVDSETEEVIRVIEATEPHMFWTIEQNEVNKVRHFVDLDWAKYAVERLYQFEYDTIKGDE